MGGLALVLPVLPVIAAAITALFGWRPLTAWAAPAAAVASIGGGTVLAVHVLDHGPVTALDDLVQVDALSAFMIIVIGVVATIATVYGVAYIGAELDDEHTSPAGARSYGILVQLFIAAMLAAVIANNLGVLWVSVEATTVATAFLVGHRRSRASLEASWKYLIIGSVGVALAFLGTVLLYFASRHAGGDAHAALNWTTLTRSAPHLDPGVVRLAVGLAVLGYGTKVGLAPMHTWLPDAHSQAPAPVSGLMSGVLLSVAFYTLLRFKVIADAAVGAGYMRGLLTAGALLSLGVAASLLIGQRDYKRLLAYSSIEHMGLITLGAAIGSPLAVGAALLHVLGHGLAKTVAFCASGDVLRADGTTEISGVRALLTRRPFTGGVFGFALLALLGLPPFSLFASELAIARAGFADGLGWAVVTAFVLVFVAFGAVVTHGQRMLLGEPGSHATPALAVRVTAGVPLVAGLVAAAALGVSIWPIERLLTAAAAIVAP